MKFCRFGTKVLNLGAIAFADMNIPAANDENDWFELVIYFNGGSSTVLYGDDALAAWRSIQLYSISLTAPSQIDKAS